uniref:Uncharacterized protein n=1 Tax=Lepeophtheirus salmonis TaxID=72036 RepID=A0A0K2TE19_LEPSM
MDSKVKGPNTYVYKTLVYLFYSNSKSFTSPRERNPLSLSMLKMLRYIMLILLLFSREGKMSAFGV